VRNIGDPSFWPEENVQPSPMVLDCEGLENCLEVLGLVSLPVLADSGIGVPQGRDGAHPVWRRGKSRFYPAV
jgi:hypothetical protein